MEVNSSPTHSKAIYKWVNGWTGSYFRKLVLLEHLAVLLKNGDSAV